MKKCAIAFAAVLALAGCSESDSEARPTGGSEQGSASASVEGDGPQTTVDATETVTWENGLSAKIVSVIATPTQSSSLAEKGQDTEVRITVELSNGGTEAFVFSNPLQGPNGPRDTLFYGQNLYEAQGWANPDSGMEKLPKRLAPGTSATFTGIWGLAAKDLQVLTYTFNPDHGNLLEGTFTGVESLIA